MANVLPRLKRHNCNEALFQHKLRPCFLVSKEKEFHPHTPCKVCFPHSAVSDSFTYEELGVRNLLKMVQSLNGIPVAWRNTLMEHFESLQVHWGQIEKLHEITIPKLYVVFHQDKWDLPILAYTLLTGLEERVEFLNSYDLNNAVWLSTFNFKIKNGLQQVLFINLEDSETHLNLLGHKLSDSAQSNIYLVPISMCYEFPSDNITSNRYQKNFEWKPNVRITFGIPHSFQDFIGAANKRNTMVSDLVKHLHHEIWRNTPIMSIHVLSMILQHRLRQTEITLPACRKLMDEFQKEFRSHHDLAFVGEIEKVARYSLKILSSKGICPTSVAVDVMKLESLMMKSLFSLVDLMGVDSHQNTCRISQNRLLENYRMMTGILRHEIEFISPPCLEASSIEKKTLDLLICNCVVSLQSDEPNSDEQQKAKKIALHLDLELEEEDEYFLMPVCETFLYVNLDNALSRKWVTSVATSLFGIYYAAARHLLELRKVDVIEETVFIDQISAAMQDKCVRGFEVMDLHGVVRNALKLFAEEKIVENYCHSGIKILYLKESSNLDNLWKLIHSIAQFC